MVELGKRECIRTEVSEVSKQDQLVVHLCVIASDLREVEIDSGRIDDFALLRIQEGRLSQPH